MRRLVGWIRMPWPDLFILGEALGCLAAAKARLALLPFRDVAGAPVTRRSRGTSEERRRRARRVGWAIKSVRGRGGLSSNCLAEAVAARWMLSRRGVAASLHLGVRKPSREAMRAHAWLEVAGQRVVGGRLASAHVAISKIAPDHR